MDADLYLIEGQKLSRLRSQDLDVLTRALIATIRGRALLTANYTYGSRYIRVDYEGRAVLVSKNDWLQIMPYVADGTFDPTLNSVGHQVGYSDSKAYAEPIIDQADRLLYTRINGILRRLFPESF